VVPQCGHFKEMPVSTDRLKDAGSVVMSS
jgi:hypothetical protein